MNEATFTVGAEDLIAANRFHFRNLFSAERWTFAFLVSASAIALLIYSFDLGFDVRDFLYMLGAVWALVIGICIMGWFLIPRQGRRTWAQAEKLWIETVVRWDSDKLHFTNARGVSSVPWSNYYRWAADDRSILLYQDERSFFTLPLRQFPVGARETIIGYLKAAGIAAR